MSHISTLRLHQFRLGELEGGAADTVHAHLAGCEVCASRLGYQRDVRLAFQREPDTLLPSPPWHQRLRRWWVGAALVPALAAAALAFGLIPSAPAEDVVRIKGAHPVLEAWVQTGDSARPLYTGEAVRAGTRIQLKFDPGAHRFVTLAGRDGTGAVEVYGTLTAAGPGLATAPFALTLDATAGAQAFFAVLTDSRPDPAGVSRALRDDPAALREAEVASVVLAKE
jgi:hypothetical protein